MSKDSVTRFLSFSSIGAVLPLDHTPDLQLSIWINTSQFCYLHFTKKMTNLIEMSMMLNSVFVVRDRVCAPTGLYNI